MPRTRQATTLGQELAEQFDGAVEALRRVPLPGSRQAPVLEGVDARGGFLEPHGNVIVRALNTLNGSGRVFVHGDNVVMTARGLGGQDSLLPLRTGGTVEPGAEDWLANLFVCAAGDTEFTPPRGFVETLLRHDGLGERLPRIQAYALRPVFDRDFVLRGPGWHPDQGILVHGPAVEPAILPEPDPALPALDRLPPHLRNLLKDFCFRGDADLANCVGTMVTGLLVSHFIEPGKPIALVDGNQPSLGKTLLVRTIGMVLDGAEPSPITFKANDEELQKEVVAKLRGPARSVLLFDNAKVHGGRLGSAVIEANSTAPEIQLRILGVSSDLRRVNDLLWFITMNDTAACPDIVARSVPIRLHHEGLPSERRLRGDPLEYARRNRLAILGELAGMVVRWAQRGRPLGGATHRLSHWAATVSGILATAGFPEFLANAGEAATDFNSELDELAAVLEAVLANPGAQARTLVMDQAGGHGAGDLGLPAKDWETFLRAAKVHVAELDETRSERGRSIRIGRLLGRLVDRQVPVAVKGRMGRATLRHRAGRSRAALYSVEVEWDPGAAAERRREREEERPEPKATPTAPRPARAPLAVGGGNHEAW